MIATEKQIKYLMHILECENLKLYDVTCKEINQLTHDDIKLILKELKVVNTFTPCFKNKKYIIEKKTDDYIIGKQIINKNKEQIIYSLICFKELLVLDWDVDMNNWINKSDLLKEIKDLLSKSPYTFYIYETYNGYHAYCISHKFEYNNYKTVKLMKSLKCDISYISYTRKIGFVVRLNKKPNRDEIFVEKFICQINKEIDENLKFLIYMKDTLLEK